jgi:hypothetical protein
MKHEMNRRLSLGLCIDAPRSNRRRSNHIAMNIAAVGACIILFLILLLIASY